MKIHEIYDVLKRIQGCTFASMDNITQVKLKGGKKNPMQGRVTKHTSNNQVILFTNQNSNGYANMVRRRLEAEGKNPESFTLGSLPWGERVPNTPLIEHKGKYYIQVIFNRGGSSVYFLDDQEIQPEDIEGFDAPVISGEGQGLSDENAVVVRTFALDSIKEIRLMGETL